MKTRPTRLFRSKPARTNVAALLLFGGLLASICAQAYTGYVTNPWLPYPPGCVTLPDFQSAIYGNNRAVAFEGQVMLESAHDGGGELPANLVLSRIACAEPGRSVVMAEFSIPPERDPAGTHYLLSAPYFADTEGIYSYGARLSAEPSTWGSLRITGEQQVFGGHSPGTTDGHERVWRFVLEFPPYLEQFWTSPWYWPTQPAGAVLYNAAFDLYIGGQRIRVPATVDLLQRNDRLPISGRLSGNWVVEGASDQGFLLSVVEGFRTEFAIPDPMNPQLRLWLRWYTFDAQGRMLWLQGRADFERGDSEVSFEIQQPTDGQFMHVRGARKGVVGSARLVAHGCNDLALEYNLQSLGLGSGVVRLVRLQALELAGYACRDWESRRHGP